VSVILWSFVFFDCSDFSVSVYNSKPSSGQAYMGGWVPERLLAWYP